MGRDRNETGGLDYCCLWGIQDKGQEEDGVGKVLGGHFKEVARFLVVPGVPCGACDEGEGEGAGKDVPGGDGEV